MNAAVQVYSKILRRRRPLANEPERYASPAHAFAFLRSHSHMDRATFAFKLGVSVPMVEKIESGAYGGSPQLDTVNRAIELAENFRLPAMAKYLGFIHTHLRMKPRRGPKPASQIETWYNPEREGVT